MSMIGNIARIPNETLLKLHHSPELITSLLYPEISSPAQLKSQSAISLPPLSKLDTMDLDKAWHGLHFVFTGSNWEGDFPQGFLVTNGKPVGDIDAGYGPARTYDPDEVERIATFLESQNETDLRKRFDPEKMTELEIYPGFGENIENAGEEWEYVADNFRNMKAFVKETAAKRMALLVYLN